MAKGKPTPKPQTTTIHIPREYWFLLRRVTLRRALKRGGRVTISDVVVELVERHRKELERESA
jgi:predicted CopG family antitoxin